jgi:hypothetical protein
MTPGATRRAGHKSSRSTTDHPLQYGRPCTCLATVRGRSRRQNASHPPLNSCSSRLQASNCFLAGVSCPSRYDGHDPRQSKLAAKADGSLEALLAAVELFSLMPRRQRDSYTYTVVMGLLGWAGRPGWALGGLEDAQLHGIRPNV